jgi:hypothetical protein
MFANDTACTAGDIISLERLVNFASTELTKVARWFQANKMAVNICKTKEIIFCTK